MTPQRSLTSTVDAEERDRAAAGSSVMDVSVRDDHEADTAVGTAAELLAMKVSALIEARPEALDLLVAYGFTPLKQPHLRAILAPTVTLAQALRIRSQSAEKERALLSELVALFTGRGAVRGA